MTMTANPDELLEAAAAFIAKVESYNIQVDRECFCPYLRLKAAVASARPQADVALPSIEEMSGLIADWDQGAAPNTRP